MLSKGRTCGFGSIATNNCLSNPSWAEKGFCQQTCNDLGLGYGSLPCCLAPSMPPPLYPPPCPPQLTQFKSMAFTELRANNLGGLGPANCADVDTGKGPECEWGDAPMIAYAEVAEVMIDGEAVAVDLVVQNVSTYTPEIKPVGEQGGVKLNGIKKKGQGEFGVVNVASPSRTKLVFEFINSVTGEPVVMPDFAITFYDFDCQANEDDLQNGRKWCESISARGFDYVLVSNTSELDVQIDPDGEHASNSQLNENPDKQAQPGPGGVSIRQVGIEPINGNGAETGFIKAAATQHGAGRDNPQFTHHLNKLHMDRSITFVYTDAERMDIIVEVESTLDMLSAGRNFLFSFQDPWHEPCDQLLINEKPREVAAGE